MAFSTLLVVLRIHGANEDVLSVARDVAMRLDLGVVGMVAKQAATQPYFRGAGPFEPHEHDQRKFVELAAAAEETARATLAGVKSIDWRAKLTLGPAYEVVANEARSADLLVVPADHRGRFAMPSGEPDVGDLLMGAGRPILIVPQGANGFKFRQTLLCFKDTREARRVAADALPMLQASERVHLAEVVDSQAIEASKRALADLRDWLARHGVEAQGSPIAAKGSEAFRLQTLAKDIDADLIVAGAFGHSRLREWAFGGVTHDLLLQGDRCVLASH